MLGFGPITDRMWFFDGMKNCFILPPAAPLWQRLWGIRHIRWAYWLIWVEREARKDVAEGRMPSLYNNWLLYAIGRGWV